MIKLKNIINEIEDDNLNKEIDNDIKEWADKNSLQEKRKITKKITEKIGKLHFINEQKVPSTKEEWMKEIEWRKKWADSGFNSKCLRN
jgi:hypothetical protein